MLVPAISVRIFGDIRALFERFEGDYVCLRWTIALISLDPCIYQEYDNTASVKRKVQRYAMQIGK